MPLAEAATATPPPAAPPLPRAGAQLTDALWAERGTVLLSGTQALLRLALMQRALDAQRGWATQGFISGYRGSPLGMVDQQVWKAGPRFAQAGIRFVPAVNEELAATQVLGTQRVEADAQRTADGVFALWYGKGPGVDRAGDAIKHGNAYGSSPHGGVLVVAGDDHGCMSSSMPHQSDQAFMAWSMPVLQPANVAELVEFGLYGWALSRYSGAWVGLAALSEVVESTCSVDVDALQQRAAAWLPADAVAQRTGHSPPPGGLHMRWPDLPSLAIEARLADKLTAVAAFARVNSIDRLVLDAPAARVGIVTCGKAHADVMEVLRRLGIAPASLAAAGLRLYKVGLAFPVEPSRMLAFAQGLDEILVIEEKGAVVETQLRALFYNAPAGQRPRLAGKQDVDGTPLVSALGELRPSRLVLLLARWLARHFPGDAHIGGHLPQVADFTPPPLLANDSDSVKRAPYFCAGCPHNTSTRVPDGSRAQAGIGCHFMASWMDRSTAGLIQMGGEGVDWLSHALFTRTPHVFQNLGDGTYFHSGYLAIRQAVASGANITYKILFNDAVAMTGGQPVDGPISVLSIARQVHSEGVRALAIVSDDIGKYAAERGHYPAGTSFDDRAALDAVQRRLRELPGTTVLIYEQTCAAEKRRRRKKQELPQAPRRLFINPLVCEGCGDCTVQSNCVAVLPLEAETLDARLRGHDGGGSRGPANAAAGATAALGRKRRIDQAACNQDERCADGFCPSFVSIQGASLRRVPALLAGPLRAAFDAHVAALPLPPAHDGSAPWDLLVTGVGGTGVVTVGALVAMAAHLAGWQASVLDFMGFAQKGGAVLSFVRLAARADQLHQVRIDTQQADAVLACDLVVGASPEALQTVRHGRTRVLANIHEQPVAEALHNPDAELKVDLLLAKLRFAAGDAQVMTFDAQQLALDFLGDTVAANVLALGFAWQRGLVPVPLAALQQAITLNNVAVPANLLALSLGRLAAADAQAAQALLQQAQAPEAAGPAGMPAPTAGAQTLDALVAQARAELSAYQDARYAQRWLDRVQAVAAHERRLGLDSALPLAQAVGRSLLKLMLVKDEYEVARLYTDGRFQQLLAAQFDGQARPSFHLAPPLLARPKNGQAPRKITFGPWLMPLLRALAQGRRLRGSWLDVFGRTAERRFERQLLADFEARCDELLAGLPPGGTDGRRLALAVSIAQVPMAMRGFGHVKLAQVALARAREAELLHRWDAQRHPRPAAAPQAGQLRGIAVVSG